MAESVVKRKGETVEFGSLASGGGVATAHSIDMDKLPDHLRRGMVRRASVSSGVGVPSSEGVSNTFFSPFRIRPSLEAPTKRVDLNEWYRYYAKHDPIVGSAIELHSHFPLSKFSLEHEDTSLSDLFNAESENLDLEGLLPQMASEFYSVGECLVPGTLIMMADGTEKPIEEVGEGDMVITHTGDKHMVMYPTERDADGHIISLSVVGGGKLKLTERHPVFAYRKYDVTCPFPSNDKNCWVSLEGIVGEKYIPSTHYHNKREELIGKFINAGELKQGDFVSVPVIKEIKNNQKLTKAKCRLFGYYISEGDIGFNYSKIDGRELPASIVIGVRDKLFADRIAICMENAYGKCPSRKEYNDSRDGSVTYWCKLYSSEAAKDILYHCGKNRKDGSSKKKLSKEVMMLHPEKQREIFIGAVDGDGSVDKTGGNVVFENSTYNLSIQLYNILLRLNYTPSLTSKLTNFNKSTVVALKYYNNCTDIMYRLKLSSRESYDFLDKINRPNENFRKTAYKSRQGKVLYKDGKDNIVRMLCRIDSIERIPYIGKVYNIAVEGDNSYVANRIAVHNCFPFGFLDDPQDPSRFERFILLDPDNIRLNKHPFAKGNHDRDYVIRLQPDGDLKKIVNNGPNDAHTGELYRNIPSDIIDYVKSSRSIPLHPLQVSHFKRQVNPFNVRGESLLSRVLQDLMILDKYRDAQWCLSPDTEVLTKRGFIKIPEVLDEDIVATFNKETEKIEYHKPHRVLEFNHDGDMYHFRTEKTDFTCTPNHRMLVKGTSTNTNWKVVRADEVKHTYKIRTNGIWDEGVEPEPYVSVADTQWEVKNYLRFAGYYVVEGCSSIARKKDGSVSSYITAAFQDVESPDFDFFKNCCEESPVSFSYYERKTERHGNGTQCQMVIREGSKNKLYYDHFSSEFGKGCETKKVPVWIKQLKPEYLEIFLEAAVRGDGSIKSDRKDGSTFVTYASVSKALVDDIQEMAWKCGYNPRIQKDELLESGKTLHRVGWSSDKQHGLFPILNRAEKTSDGTWKQLGKDSIETYQYKGKVYCLEVPNGFFVTRYNGKISIHGNSIADRHLTPSEFYLIGEPGDPADEAELQDFRDVLAGTFHSYNRVYVWHHAVNIHVEGTQGKLLPMAQEYDFLKQRIMAGLMLNESWLYGSGCVDDQTEVLTEHGWKFPKDVTNERLAAYNPEAQSMQFEPILGRVYYDHSGDMIHITSGMNSSKYDLFVTPDHRMFYKDAKTGLYVSGEAQDMKNGDLVPGNIKLWKDESYYDASNHEQKIEICGEEIDLDLFLKFAGFYVSEGCTITKPETRNYQVRVSQSKKYSGKYNKFKDIMDQLPWKVNVYNRDTEMTEWVICNKKLAYWMKEQFGRVSGEKFLPYWMKNLDERRLDMLLEYLMLGDGNIQCEPRHTELDEVKRYQKITVTQCGYPRAVYTSISKQLSDDVQEIALKLGYTPRLVDPDGKHNVCYRVKWGLLKERTDYLPIKVEKKTYEGKVYCFEVPSHYMLYRRNGVVGISGQTYANASVALEILISRYMEFRNKLERWVVKYIFEPLCKMNNIYKPTEAELSHRIRIRDPLRKAWVPKVTWERPTLRDDTYKVQLIERLVNQMLLPREDLYRALNKNSDQVREELKRQNEQDMKDKEELGAGAAGMNQQRGPGAGLPMGLPPGGGGGGMGMGGMGLPSALPMGAGNLPIPGANPNGGPLSGAPANMRPPVSNLPPPRM